MKQYELAVGLRAEGNAPGAFKALYQALELDPNNAKAHLLLASIFLLGREENPKSYDKKAEEHFRKVVEIQQGDYRDPEESLIADARNGLGVLYIHQRRYPEAVKVLEASIEDLFNRKTYMAWGNLGWAYEEMGQIDKAIDALTRSVKVHPRFCVGHFRLGRAFMAKKEYEDAERSLTLALEADERCEAFQDAWHLRGEVRMNLGHREDARADFERCVELSSSNETGKACARYLEATF